MIPEWDEETGRAFEADINQITMWVVGLFLILITVISARVHFLGW